MRSSLIAAVSVVVALGVTGCGDREDESRAAPEEPPREERDTPPPDPPSKAAPRSDEPEEARSHESLLDAMGDQMDAFAVALTSVKDEESVARVGASLKDIESAMREIARELEGMSPPSNAERERLSLQMQAREEAMEDLLGSREEFLGNLDPSVREALLEVMAPFNAMLEEIGVVLDAHFEPDPEPGIPDPAPLGEPGGGVPAEGENPAPGE